MSRFAFTTLLAVIAFFAIGYFLSGWTRIWAFTAFWSVYVALIGCGVAFIQLNFFCRAICRGTSGRNKVALTFDDGPDPAATLALLDLLRAEGISAAFFCIGKNVHSHPEIAARIAAEGHLLGNHTYSHARWTPLERKAGLSREIDRAQQEIRQAAGVTPRYMRPPVGLTNPHYASVLRRCGMTMIGWDVRSMDTRWEAPRVIDRVVSQCRDGSIILLHDANTSADRLVGIVREIIRGVQARGLGFERLDRLIEAAH